MKTKQMKTTIQSIAPPTEDVYGFWGTIQTNSYCEETDCNHIDEAAADRIWAAACLQVAETFDENNPNVIRNFLRSRYGRHLADELFTEATCTENDLVANLADVLNRKSHNVLVWKRDFRNVKETTLNGEWID